MTKKPENPQAFPMATGDRENGGDWVEGMTLRDYFAAKADMPWNAAHDILVKAGMREEDITLGDMAKARARYKYFEADAMLAERGKGE